MSENKNSSKLISDIMLAIPQVMDCINCTENKALAVTVSAILDDLTSGNPTKLGDGKILAALEALGALAKLLLPIILPLLMGQK